MIELTLEYRQLLIQGSVVNSCRIKNKLIFKQKFHQKSLAYSTTAINGNQLGFGRFDSLFE